MCTVTMCFFATGSGQCNSGRWHSWEGSKPAEDQGDRIGLLLVLDQGSVTGWKNDVQLGVMRAEGLSGPLCWGP